MSGPRVASDAGRRRGSGVLVVPAAGEGPAFLRALRVIRLLRSLRRLERLREKFPFFRHNEKSIVAAADICVFIFIMTGVVYDTQHRHNPNIHSYADAL